MAPPNPKKGIPIEFTMIPPVAEPTAIPTLVKIGLKEDASTNDCGYLTSAMCI